MRLRRGKSYDYLHELSELAKISVEAAKYLDRTLKNYDKSYISEIREKAHDIEHRADDAKHTMMKKLIGEFLPPIDRGDIINLSHDIDSITDAIEDIFICYDMFGVDTVYDDIIEFTELIVECCEHTHLAIVEMKNYKKSTKLFDELDKVNHLKSKGEALYVNSLRKLYSASKDPVHIMAYTEIYKRLQKCCENCKKVTNRVESVVMKNI